MQYKISLETDYAEVDYIFHNFASAKARYSEVLAAYMLRGWRFSIELFSGVADKQGVFWHHQCIATFDYDGDKSVLEACND